MLRQATDVTVKVGPLVGQVNSSIIQQPEVVAEHIYVCSNGGKMVRKNEATPAVHDQLGMFDCRLSAPDVTDVGQLDVIMYVSGAKLVHHTFQVIPQAKYDELFKGKPVKMEVDNLFDANGFVRINPDIALPIDLKKIINKDAAVNLPGVTVGTVGKLSGYVDHSKDLSDLTDYVVALHEGVSEDAKAVSAGIGNINKSIGNLKVNEVIELVRNIQEKVTEYNTVLGQLAAKDVDVAGPINAAVEDLSKTKDIQQIAALLVKLSIAIQGLKIPTVKEITGGGPLDTKDGCVRVVNGDKPGEISLTDGMVIASDVKNKSGYKFSRDGFETIKHSLDTLMADLWTTYFGPKQTPSNRRLK